MDDTSVGFMKGSEMIGIGVVNREGEDLGNIRDVVIDLDYGVIAYAVLSFGGFLGLGDKLFAIPISAMEFDRDGNRFILDVDEERLKNAEGFDRNNWPDFANYEWGGRIYEYYDSPRYWEEE